jgi:6,7-dimethyl-8-ribityllumazine synthase
MNALRQSVNVLILESRYFPAIGDALVDGATLALEKGGARFERFSLPGVLELPAAIAVAAGSARPFDAYVALGCVTGLAAVSDTLYREAMRGLMTLGTRGLAIGNGVLLAADEDRAMALAIDQDAGGDAARAALSLVTLRERLRILS